MGGWAGWLGPDEWQAVRLSLRVSGVATLASLPLGILAAHALARWSFRGKALLNGLVHLPLILPPVVTGYLLLAAFGRRGVAGAFLEQTFGIVFAFRWTGAALAAAVMAFPLMVRAIRLAVEAVDPRLEQAAATLGASPARVWATVTLPLILPGVISGALFAFVTSFDEVVVVLFVAGHEEQTIPRQMWNGIREQISPAILAVATILVVVSVALLATVEILRRRSERLRGLAAA
jgi:molybdate transport system permease protein